MAQWQKALKPVPGLKAIDSLQPEKSAVSEELNLAWARHELISDSVDEVRRCFLISSWILKASRRGMSHANVPCTLPEHSEPCHPPPP